ncbi:HTH-type transcriptional regulator DmlR [Andreprevotia sp. IGB-42]|uniref:LysR family transcriptional regulator n=1 Tax=Andreprevotia sp. IGB-42 TaxID=2497473 RepID=UPI00135A0642|nr:LysR family transcriptional regulator [Andreprevotia sp. IGB-42]KAF0814887.1 HTH-type transcriptional regulator DmlR [Andreprevotia sp. IGB-42]
MKNINQLDWNDLKYFLAVARGGGLTPAATQLHTSASTVSRHIDSMEALLGARLFLRQQRGYLLTDQGSALFEQVAEVERAMLGVERSSGALGAAGVVSGRVKFATSETLAHQLISPNLGLLLARHPALQVELVVNRNLADLGRREADLALRIVGSASTVHDPDYIAHRVGELPFALYAAPALLAAAPDGDWHQLPYITWDESWTGRPMGVWLSAAFGAREPILRTNSVTAQYVAAGAGLGVVSLPCFFGDAQPGLLRLADVDTGTVPELWLVYHRDLKASQRVRAMREFVTELVQGLAAG